MHGARGKAMARRKAVRVLEYSSVRARAEMALSSCTKGLYPPDHKPRSPHAFGRVGEVLQGRSSSLVTCASEWLPIRSDSETCWANVSLRRQ